ncbi:MAG: hypothetical protein II661_09970 [Bacteroidales bacterium]|nr:hypothetical protein [Bacteroidales bacterium]
MKNLNVQLWLGASVAFAGLTLLFFGLICPPKGVIDPSVLVAFGEVATFSAGLIGIDYKYKNNILRNKNND